MHSEFPKSLKGVTEYAFWIATNFLEEVLELFLCWNPSKGVSVDITCLGLGSSGVFYDSAHRHIILSFVQGEGPFPVNVGVHLGNSLQK